MLGKFGISVLTAAVISYLLQLSSYGSTSSENWDQLNSTADALYQQGEYEQSQAVWRKALVVAQQIGPQCRELGTTYSNLAMVATSLGHPETALALHKKAVAMLQVVTGKQSTQTAAALVNEAECLRGLKRYSEAEHLYKTALPILQGTKDATTQDAFLTLNNLALCYKNEGKLVQAERAYKDVLTKVEKNLGAQDPLVAVICSNLGSLYIDQRQFLQAEQQLKRVLLLQDESNNQNAFAKAAAMNNLAMLYDKQGKKKQAASLFRDSLELVKKNLGTGSGAYGIVFINYLASLIQSGHKVDADKLIHFVAAHNTDTFQEAVDNVDKNPKLAEQKLKTLDFPSAKAFLAYLYFTHKVPIKDPGMTVDKLMLTAIAGMQQDDLTLQAIAGTEDRQTSDVTNTAKLYHYTDLKTLLQHLRFIVDDDQLGIRVPNSIFENYPVEAFEAFQSYWGSGRDGSWPLEFDVKENGICRIPAISQYLKVVDELLGDHSGCLMGSMVIATHRNQALTIMKASITPQMFLPGVKRSKHDIEEEIDPNLDSFLEDWSNQELWNKIKYKQWLIAKKEAETALTHHYIKHFALSEDKARICANTAIAAISTTYFSYVSIEKKLPSDLYKTFSQGKLTLAQMQQALNGKTLSTDEMREALQLTILNDGNLEIVKWLLDQGAPLTGAKEPALYSAVLRPEVVGLLLQAGANVNETNLFGKTALFQAVQFNCLDSVKRLVAAGANIQHSMRKPIDNDDPNEDPNLKYNNDYNYTIGNRTSLMYATTFAGYPVIQYLLEKGADTKVTDSSGATAETYLADNKLISKAERDELLRRLHN